MIMQEQLKLSTLGEDVSVGGTLLMAVLFYFAVYVALLVLQKIYEYVVSLSKEKEVKDK